MFARNAYNTDFGGRVAFFDVDDPSRTLSGDRTEFLGRNGTLRDPDAMGRVLLSGRLGAALDPCGVIRVPFDLANGQEREVIFRLGSAGVDLERAQELALRLRQPGSARLALQKVRQSWRRTLGACRLRPPTRRFNVLANGWLVYQTLSCRLWGRSGYTSPAAPSAFATSCKTRWPWCMPSRRWCASTCCAARHVNTATATCSTGGIRPAVEACARAVRTISVAAAGALPLRGRLRRPLMLDEHVHFLEGRQLAADEESYYDVPARSADTATLVRALRARHRAQPALWRARTAADGIRRLERRHESGRHPWPW
jgi:cyclic beta-1,2-glucan synthetase